MCIRWLLSVVHWKLKDILLTKFMLSGMEDMKVNWQSIYKRILVDSCVFYIVHNVRNDFSS